MFADIPCHGKITTEVGGKEGNRGESPGPFSPVFRARRVFAREMERKLGLDGDRTPRRIEIKAARKIYATPRAPPASPVTFRRTRDEGYTDTRLSKLVDPVKFFSAVCAAERNTPSLARDVISYANPDLRLSCLEIAAGSTVDLAYDGCGK